MIDGARYLTHNGQVYIWRKRERDGTVVVSTAVFGRQLWPDRTLQLQRPNVNEILAQWDPKSTSPTPELLLSLRVGDETLKQIFIVSAAIQIYGLN